MMCGAPWKRIYQLKCSLPYLWSFLIKKTMMFHRLFHWILCFLTAYTETLSTGYSARLESKRVHCALSPSRFQQPHEFPVKSDWIAFIEELLRVEGSRVEPHTLENLVTHQLKVYLSRDLPYVHMYVRTPFAPPLARAEPLTLKNKSSTLP